MPVNSVLPWRSFEAEPEDMNKQRVRIRWSIAYMKQHKYTSHDVIGVCCICGKTMLRKESRRNRGGGLRCWEHWCD